MHTTIQLLDALSKKFEGASDYRIGKMLNVSSSAVVSNWRNGRSFLSQDYALKVAELLGWEPAYVIACVERERAEKDSRLEQTDEIKATWEKIADKFRPIAASILLACLGLFTGFHSSTAQAFTSTEPQLSDNRSIHYAKYKQRRPWWPTPLGVAAAHPGSTDTLYLSDAALYFAPSLLSDQASKNKNSLARFR